MKIVSSCLTLSPSKMTPRSTSADEQRSMILGAVHLLLSSFSRVKLVSSPNEGSKDNVKMHRRIDLSQVVLHRAAKVFLSSLENVAQVLGLQMVSRKYRHAFTRNYRSLMPTDKRLYRIDVLEAGQESHRFLWVNGEKYELNEDVLNANQEFRENWSGLLTLLEEMEFQIDGANPTHHSSLCSETRIDPEGYGEREKMYMKLDWLALLGPDLVRFDKTWTHFERNYINNLICIEKHSRRLIMDCVYAEEELRLYEILFEQFQQSLGSEKNNGVSNELDSSQIIDLVSLIRLSYSDFITYVARLQKATLLSKADTTACTFCVLERVFSLIKLARLQLNLICEKDKLSYFYFYREYGFEEWDPHLTQRQLHFILPGLLHLMKQTQKLRNVFYLFSLNPERVDPYIAQNISLVARLQHFHISWNVIAPYLESEQRIVALASFLSFVHHVGQLYRTFLLEEYGYNSDTEANSINTSCPELNITKCVSLTPAVIFFSVSSFSLTLDHLTHLNELLPDIFGGPFEYLSRCFLDVPHDSKITSTSSLLELFNFHVVLHPFLTRPDRVESSSLDASTDLSEQLILLIAKGYKIAQAYDKNHQHSSLLMIYVIHRCLITPPHVNCSLDLLKRFSPLSCYTDLIDDFILTFNKCTAILQQSYSVQSSALYFTCLKYLEGFFSQSTC